MKEKKRNKSFKVGISENELVSKVELVDRFTGEVRDEVPNLSSSFYIKGKRPKNGMKKYEAMDIYHRRSFRAWELLRTQTTAREYIVADKMANRAKAFTSSLEPLSPESTVTEIADELKEDRRTIKKIIDKLFKLGVIGKFEVYNDQEEHTKYWVFNTFLSFNGDYIKKSVEDLFADTYYAKV